jgi:undecaprenyl-diphosphatase
MPLLLAALALVWAAMLTFGTRAGDTAVLVFLYAGGNPALIDAAWTATQTGSFQALMGATALGLIRLTLRRDWRGALILAGVTLSGRLLVEAQKIAVGRLRPADHDPLVAIQSYAFPSGHAANATIVFLCLAILLPRTASGRRLALWVAAVLAAAAGISRPMLGVHWPSDVAAGWAFGLAWTLLLLRLCGRPETDCSPASA